MRHKQPKQHQKNTDINSGNDDDTGNKDRITRNQQNCEHLKHARKESGVQVDEKAAFTDQQSTPKWQCGSC